MQPVIQSIPRINAGAAAMQNATLYQISSFSFSFSSFLALDFVVPLLFNVSMLEIISFEGSRRV